MTANYINPKTMAPPAGPYTHVVQVGNFIYISGQAALHPESGELVSDSFQVEATLVFENIKRALAEVGATMKNVVKVQAHLGDRGYKEEYNSLYKQYFKPPYPARTTVSSNLGKIKIEIDVVAYKE